METLGRSNYVLLGFKITTEREIRVQFTCALDFKGTVFSKPRTDFMAIILKIKHRRFGGFTKIRYWKNNHTPNRRWFRKYL